MITQQLSDCSINNLGVISEVIYDKRVIFRGTEDECMIYIDENIPVTYIDELPITRPMLQSVFEKFENKEHWKNPIDIKLPESVNLDLFEMKLIVESIEFYHGSKAEIYPIIINGSSIQWRIKSIGYKC